MKQRYRLFHRNWGTYYIEDTLNGKQVSLKTQDKKEAQRLFHAKNEAQKQPLANMQMARMYMLAADPDAASRTWRYAFNAVAKTKKGVTFRRWTTALKDRAFESIMDLPIVETRADHFLKVLEIGKVSTNVFLRRVHNFVLDMAWLPTPVLPRKQWPKVEYGEKRGIKFEEHQKIIARERNPERRAFYQLCWYLGGSQTDMASLHAEDIDWQNRIVSYHRRKTGKLAQQHFGDDVATILRSLPSTGPLFPYLITVRECDRATEFRQRCSALGLKGITLHSYRYGWAERAKECAFPERFAAENLGHGKAVHRAYARKAKAVIPALENWEKDHAAKKLIPVNFSADESPTEHPNNASAV